MSTKLRIVFMGTPEFAVPPLQALVQSGHQVLLVVTQPDRPSGRGLRSHPSPVKEEAEKLGVPLFQPGRLKESESIALLREVSPDLVVTAAFAQWVPREILSLPRHGCVNIHPSLLPRYRGPSPIERAILSGDSVTGVTLYLMDEGWDTGDILAQESLPIDPEETGGSLHRKLADLGAAMIPALLERMERGPLVGRPQDNRAATHAPPIREEEALISWSGDALFLERQVRAFNPRPCAYAWLQGRRIRILRALAVPVPSGDAGGAAPAEASESLAGAKQGITRAAAGGKAGTILSADRKRGLIVATARGALRILELQPQGRKPMRAADFLNGHPLEEGSAWE